MSVCFMIMAHKEPEQFKDLAGTLLAAGGRVVAFIDKKADIEPFRLEGVEYIEHRHSVNWGGYSQVLAMEKTMNAALELYPESSHYMWTSAQDYPLKPVDEFIKFMSSEENAQRSFMEVKHISEGSWHDKVYRYPENMGYKDQEVKSPLLHKFRRKILSIIHRLRTPKYTPDMYFGSTSWVLDAQTMAAILSYYRSPEGYSVRKYTRHVFACDEKWLPSSLMRIPERKHVYGLDENLIFSSPESIVVDEKIHYIDWSPERENPALLTVDDLPAMDASGKWFARKFDVDKSAQLLEVLRKRQS